MEYTIFQMLLSLFLSGVLGLLVGFVLRGGSGQSRARDLEHRLAEAEADADSHRSEASRLAAELQSRAFAGGDAAGTVRLEGDLKRTRAELDQLGGQNAELRAYVADLERQLASAERSASAPADAAGGDENAAAWRAHALGLETRLAELEPAAQDAATLRAEVETLRAQLAEFGAAAATGAETAGVSGESLAALAEVEDMRARLAQAEDVASAVTAEAERLRARIDELEAASFAAVSESTQSESNQDVADEALRAELAAAVARATDAEARAAAFDAAGSAQPPGEDDEQRLYWLTARNRWLERKLDEARAALGAAPAEVVEADRARLDQLSADLAAARDDVARLSGELTAARDALATAEASAAAAPVIASIAAAATGVANEAANGTGEEAELGADAVAELARLRWRNRYLASRVKYLETKTAEAEAAVEAATASASSRVVSLDEAAGVTPFAGPEAPGELEQLRKRVHELEAAATSASAEGGENYSLEWRNRYLASRVRYLEQRLSEQDAPTVSDATVTAGQDGAATAGAEELARLRARVSELETLSAPDVSALRNRVAELEGELSARREAETESEEGRGDGDYALEWRNRYLTSRVKYLEERLAEYRTRTEVDA